MSAGGQAGELELVRRGDPGYEEVRAGMVWNARKPARSPEVIVRAADERDVARAVRLARSAGMRWPCGRAGTTGSAARCGRAAC